MSTCVHARPYNHGWRGLNGSGVYAVLCHTTPAVYIGSTKSLKRRAQQHFSSMRWNKHFNPHLQSAYNKYGEDELEFIVLEQVDDLTTLEQREQYWLDKFVEAGNIELYNYSSIAVCSLRGRPYPEELREKRRTEQLGRRHTEESKRRISQSNIGRISGMCGKKHSAATKRKIGLTKLGKARPESVRMKLSVARLNLCKSNPQIGLAIAARTSKQYPALKNAATGEIIPCGKNLTRLCRERGFSQGDLRAVVIGKAKQYHGWTVNQ